MLTVVVCADHVITVEPQLTELQNSCSIRVVNVLLEKFLHKC